MANLTVYANEPATHGKVILHTSVGPLDVELWSKQAPIASRNFVQLCLEKYYDGCIFHRVIKGFMAQTGDPTGTGTGGESSFGSTFKDEVHGRLRFTHRGLLAMASSGPNTNASQFFITLDRCEWLDGKHTIFGKVTGNSLYNLPRFDDLETDQKDRPLYPPRIERVEILLEPFDDIVPRSLTKVVAEEAPPKKKKKEKKNLSLLSFGEEAAADDEALKSVGAKLLSSHDVLDDPRLSKERAVGVEELERKLAAGVQAADKKDAAHQALASATMKATSKGAGDDESAFEERMRQQMQEKRRRLTEATNEDSTADRMPQKAFGNVGANAADEYEKLKRDLASATKLVKESEEGSRNFKWRGKGAKHSDDESEDDDSDPETAGMSELERQRAKYIKRKRESLGLTREQRQKVTMQKLMGFKNTLSKDDSEWKSHQLKFERERREAESASTYDSFDPLKHGENDERVKIKIKEREKTMLSLKRQDGQSLEFSDWTE